MKMKKQILLIASVCCSLASQAQSLSPQVVASAGNYVSSAAGSLSYTIGEPVVTTVSGGSNILTQGFQQPNDIVSGLLDIEREAFGSFSLYPIPATDKLWFGYEFPEEGKVEIAMYDALGQKLEFTLSESYESGKIVHSFDCSNYAAGNYVLTATFITKDNNRKVLSKKFQLFN
jgi:hypothetical protein